MVIGVPFKPSLTDVKEHQCGVFEVFWKPSPFESGGGPVTDFHVQLRNRDDEWRNCTNFVTNGSCLFNVLLSQTDHAYYIRIQAVNQKGSSDWRTETKTTVVIGRNKTSLGRNCPVGNPPKFGWGCAARFLKPSPYFRPKYVIFPTLF